MGKDGPESRFVTSYNWGMAAGDRLTPPDEFTKHLAKELAALPGSKAGSRGEQIDYDSKELDSITAVMEALDVDVLEEMIADTFVIRHSDKEGLDATGIDIQMLLFKRFTDQMRKIKKVIPSKDGLMAVQVKSSSVKFDEFWRTKMDINRWKQLNMICLEGQWPVDLVRADFAIQFIALHHGLRHADRGAAIFDCMPEILKDSVRDNVHLVAQHHGQFLGWLVGDGAERWWKAGAIEEAIGIQN